MVPGCLQAEKLSIDGKYSFHGPPVDASKGVSPQLPEVDRGGARRARRLCVQQPPLFCSAIANRCTHTAVLTAAVHVLLPRSPAHGASTALVADAAPVQQPAEAAGADVPVQGGWLEGSLVAQHVPWCPAAPHRGGSTCTFITWLAWRLWAHAHALAQSSLLHPLRCVQLDQLTSMQFMAATPELGVAGLGAPLLAQLTKLTQLRSLHIHAAVDPWEQCLTGVAAQQVRACLRQLHCLITLADCRLVPPNPPRSPGGGAMRPS